MFVFKIKKISVFTIMFHKFSWASTVVKKNCFWSKNKTYSKENLIILSGWNCLLRPRKMTGHHRFRGSTFSIEDLFMCFTIELLPIANKKKPADCGLRYRRLMRMIMCLPKLIRGCLTAEFMNIHFGSWISHNVILLDTQVNV